MIESPLMSDATVEVSAFAAASCSLVGYSISAIAAATCAEGSASRAGSQGVCNAGPAGEDGGTGRGVRALLGVSGGESREGRGEARGPMLAHQAILVGPPQEVQPGDAFLFYTREA